MMKESCVLVQTSLNVKGYLSYGLNKFGWKNKKKKKKKKRVYKNNMSPLSKRRYNKNKLGDYDKV